MTYSPEIEHSMRMFHDSLSEKDRRRYAAVEAVKLGHGGIEYLATLLGCDPKTIRQAGPAHTFSLMGKTLRNQAETPKKALISGVGTTWRPGRAANTVRPGQSPSHRKTLEFALARRSHSFEVL
jgi:hypothetical protein